MANLQVLMEKMQSADKDFRYMACSDLMAELRKPDFRINERVERKLVQLLLSLLEDTNGEVQSLAVKCLPPLANKLLPELVDEVVTKLVSNMKSSEEQLRDICTIGLKSVLNELPVDTPVAFQVCKRILVPLLERIAQDDVAVALEALDVLNDLLNRFGRTIASDHAALQTKFLDLLKHKRPPVRKRATACLASLAGVATPALSATLVQTLLDSLSKKQSKADMRTLVQCVGSISQKCSECILGRIELLADAVTTAAAIEGDDELRETCLQALEALCKLANPELVSRIPKILELGISCLSYDPNYEPDDEDAMSDDEDDGEYSGDDDLSWKVRKAGALCLATAINSYPRLLLQFYDTVAPALITRFKEREEYARVEVLQTFTVLLHQTSRQAGAVRGVDRPESRLEGLVNEIIKNIQKPLKDKSAKGRLAALALLRELVIACPSALATRTSALLPSVYACITDKAMASNVRIDALGLLRQLLSAISAQALHGDLKDLTQVGVVAIGDSFYKIVEEALSFVSLLVYSLRPSLSQPVDPELQPAACSLYDAAVDRFNSSDTVQEVREKSMLCVAHAIAVFGEELTLARKPCLPTLQTRLQNEVTRIAAVRALGIIASSPLRIDVSVILKSVLATLGSFLGKNSRPLRLASLQTLMVLIGSWDDRNTLELCGMLRHSSVDGLPTSQKRRRVTARTESFSDHSTFEDILKALCPLVEPSDMQSAQIALRVAAAILCSSKPAAAALKDRIPLMPAVLTLCLSPIIQTSVVDVLVLYFRSLLSAGLPELDFAAVFKLLSDPVYAGTAPIPRQAFATLGSCIASIAGGDPNVITQLTSKFVTDLTNPASSESVKLFSLACLGELGRQADLSSRPQVVEALVGAFDSESEDIRTMAANALGNVCAGNLAVYVPYVVDLTLRQPARQFLLLHALKELFAACVSSNMVTVLAPYTAQMWDLLVRVAEAPQEGSSDSVGECLGKLALVSPDALVPDLVARLASPSPLVRSVMIVAIKVVVCLVDPIPLYVSALRQALACLSDADPEVRRKALIAFNATAHNRPETLVDLLPEMLPRLYDETKVHAELVRVVEMGPFKHSVDDGLDSRKTAYECMYSLLKSCCHAVDMPVFVERCLQGLSDQYDVQMLTFLIIKRLATTIPEDLTPRLDDFATAFNAIITAQPKANAVGQEVEKIEELKRCALRAVHALARVPGADKSAKLTALVQTIESTPQLQSRYRAIDTSDATPMEM
eukprot:m.232562 g.232562  ORF g.232562 m.232562 type:complete len:1239 (+) comp12377_c0_seq1:72-3788(+)